MTRGRVYLAGVLSGLLITPIALLTFLFGYILSEVGYERQSQDSGFGLYEDGVSIVIDGIEVCHVSELAFTLGAYEACMVFEGYDDTEGTDDTGESL